MATKRSDGERNRLHKRVLRYAKVSGAAAKIGARLASQRLQAKRKNRASNAPQMGSQKSGAGPETDRVAQAIAEWLGDLKGPLMKVAQLLGTIPQAAPETYRQAFAQLQSQAPPMGWPFVQRRMAAELGKDWQKRFSAFDRTATYAASLGQVHRAKTADGRLVACKLQYPDMASTVEADLRQLNLLLNLFERLDPAVTTERVYEEIAERMREELDYRREARHMRLFCKMLTEVEGVAVPEPVETLSTDRLLTMTWLEGETLEQGVMGKAQRAKNLVAERLFKAWYIPFYRYAALHGDPHPGNYTVRQDLGLNLLDFGCVRFFPAALPQAVLQLRQALLTGQESLAVQAYETWGFRDLDKKLLETLNIWAKFVYAPVLKDRTCALEQTNASVYGQEMALKVHRELRQLKRGLPIPRAFVFVDRASIGLGSVFLRLEANLNWFRLYEEIAENFDPVAVAKRQKEILGKARGLS